MRAFVNKFEFAKNCYFLGYIGKDREYSYIQKCIYSNNSSEYLIIMNIFTENPKRKV